MTEGKAGLRTNPTSDMGESRMSQESEMTCCIPAALEKATVHTYTCSVGSGRPLLLVPVGPIQQQEQRLSERVLTVRA